MTTFHEHIRKVLTEFDKFLDTLKTEKLSKPVLSGKEKVIEAIKKLREEFPALAASLPEKSVNDRDVSNGSISNTSNGSGNVEEEDASYSDNIPDIPAKDLTNPTKSGFLDKKKKSGLFGSYQKRYCVIKDRIFYYYQRNKDVKQNGAFNLEGYQFHEAPQLVKDSNKKELSFELVSPGKRSYQFIAESKQEYNSWKAVILQCIDGTNHAPTPVDGEMDDIYEDMEEVAEKVKALDMPTPPNTTVEVDQIEYNDAESLQKPPDVDDDDGELYDDVDNTAKPAEPEPRPPTPPPPIITKPSKPTMALPVVPPCEPPPVPPSISPSSKQEQPLPHPPEVPNVPPPRPSRPGMPPPDIPKPSRPKVTLTVSPEEDYDNMYYGKWECKADTEEELSFKRGEIIHIISREYDNKDWWVGRIEEKFGLVPKNFLIRAYKAA